MKDIQNLLQQAEQATRESKTLAELQSAESEILGKKGSLTGLLKSISTLPVEERKTVGQQVNIAKQKLRELFDLRKNELQSAELNSPVDFDVTLPGTESEIGSLHPITQMISTLNQAFLSLGFEIYSGPEISSEAYAFDNLNFPPDHPARESMDTYWLQGCENQKGGKRLCLRPHLTGASVRYMQSHKPPFRFVYPGRVFRSESTDASHERTFYQYEALIVDRKVPFSAGRLLVNTILQRVFERDVKTRMRAGFFPFVEPGFEIDMQCLVCSGSGCSVCKRTGWVEMMPGGPPHPNVLKAGGIDSEEWQGFYINIGLDRITMMKYNIDDIRLFHSADLRFLRQFAGA